MKLGERAKRLRRLESWYPKPEDVDTIGYRGMHKHNIEYTDKDVQRMSRWLARVANRDPGQVRSLEL